eukprot:m.33180 g.33180  ORF g.33180 m.33180 type:complete len:461 (+) comp16771_c1_seq1:103-1485(+)
MADISAHNLKEEVWDVRDDSTESNWIALGYETKTKIKVIAKGDDGYEGLMAMCTDDAVLFCLLRLIDGDRESRRVKFIGLTFVGENVGGMQRGRVGAHSGTVKTLFGQMNVELSADNRDECAMDIISKKLKIAGGADYDTGSNAGGYKSRGGSIRKAGLAAYKAKEQTGNIAGVLYNTSALSRTTPVDLGGRPMVASASEAKKNTKDNVLDTDKFKGKSSSGSKQSALVFKTSKPGSKPTTMSAKPKPAIKTTKPVKTPEPEPEVEEEVEEEVVEEAAPVETEPDISDDPEVRAAQRAERRKARQKAMAEKARQEVASLRAELANDEETEAAVEPEVEEPQEEEEVVEQELSEDEAVVEEEEVVEEPVVVEKKSAPAKKTTSLFDDDEDEDDDLFAKPTKTAAVEEEVEDELPQLAASDDRVVSLPYSVLKEFLVKHEFLIADFNGSEEELAQIVADDVA